MSKEKVTGHRTSLKEKERARCVRTTEERRRLSDLLTRRQRGALLNARRTQRLLEFQTDAETTVPNIFTNQEMASAVTGAIQRLRNVQERSERLCHVRYLRYLLTDSEEPPMDLMIQLEVVPLLMKELTLGESNSRSEALWALAFLADGNSSAARKLQAHTKLFVSFLDGKNGFDVAELSAWLCRSLVSSMSSNEPISVPMAPSLAKLLFMCASPGNASDVHVMDASMTAAWALCTLVAHSSTSRRELLQVPHFSSQLSNLLTVENGRIVTETAWLIAYLVALDDAHLTALIQSNVVGKLVKILALYLQADRPDIHKAYEVLTPVLRSLGNIAAGVSPVQFTELMDHENGVILIFIGKCLSCDHRGVQKESCKTLSNFAAASDGSFLDVLVSNQILDTIISFVAHSAFDIKKEAALVLANICFSIDTANGDLMKFILGRDAQIVGGIVSLTQGVDAETVKLGLDFTQLILGSISDGPQRIKDADGIDALDNLQFRDVPSDLQELASHLVDTYFGEDYGLD